MKVLLSKKLARMPQELLDVLPHSKMISVLNNDTANLQANLASTLKGFMVALNALSGSIAVFSNAWQLGLFCLLTTPCYVCVLACKGKQLQRVSEALQVQEQVLMQALTENLNGARMRKLLGLHDEFDQLCASNGAAAGKLGKQNRRELSLQDRLMDALQLGSSNLVLAAGAALVTMGRTISVGAVVSSFSTTKRIHQSLGALSAHFVTFLATQASLGTVLQFLHTPGDIAAGLGGDVVELSEGASATTRVGKRVSDTGEVVLDGVGFGFAVTSQAGPRALKPAVQGLTLHLKPGSRTCVVGRSGSGKSVLLSLVSRLYQPSAGDLMLGGTPLNHLSMSDHVAMLAQEWIMLRGSIRYNIALGAPFSDLEIQAAVEDAGLAEALAELTDGLDTRVEAGGFGISRACLLYTSDAADDM
eukprot:1652621-Prymnesium_polylepis.1